MEENIPPVIVPSPAIQTPAPLQPVAGEGIVGYCVRIGWDLLWKNPGFSIGSMVLYLVIISILSGGQWGYRECSSCMSGGMGIISFILSPVLAVGLQYAFLKVVRGGEGKVGDIFSGFSKFIPVFFTALLFYLVIIGGLLLLVVPGIIFGLGFCWSMLTVMDRNISYSQALRTSWRMMNGHKWDLFKLGLLLLVINIAGLICLVVGVVFTAALSHYALTAFYQRMLETEGGTSKP